MYRAPGRLTGLRKQHFFSALLYVGCGPRLVKLTGSKDLDHAGMGIPVC